MLGECGRRSETEKGAYFAQNPSPLALSPIEFALSKFLITKISSLLTEPPSTLFRYYYYYNFAYSFFFFLSNSAENFVFLGRYVVLFWGNWFHGLFRLIIYVIYVSLFEDEYRICSSGCDFNQTSSNSLCQLCMELEFYSRNQLNVDAIGVVLLGLSTRIKQEP